MDLFVRPFMESTVADQVMHFHFGMANPDRQRNRILKDRGIRLSKTTRSGSGTKSVLATVVLPLLVAEADRQAALADTIEKGLKTLNLDAVLECDFEAASQKQRQAIAKRFTTFLERLGRQKSEFTVDKGRVVRIDGRWALVAIGDPRNDAYRLERIAANGLRASGLDAEQQPFFRVLMQEEGRAQKVVYLAAFEPDAGPSPAIYEMLMRAKPGKPLSEGDDRFVPKRHKE